MFVAALVGESFGTVIGGGSIITQPALLMVGLPLNVTIATDNIGQLGAETGIISETRAEIASNWRLIAFMALPIMLGGIIGIYGLINTSPELIKFVMIAAILFLLVRTYFLGKYLKSWQLTRWRYPALFIFLFVIGAYTNFIGVGEGTFFRLGVMLLLGLSFMQSHGLRAMAILPTYVYVLPVAAWAGLVALALFFKPLGRGLFSWPLRDQAYEKDSRTLHAPRSGDCRLDLHSLPAAVRLTVKSLPSRL